MSGEHTATSHLLFEPEERGYKVVIRRMAPHYRGAGEIIARRVELHDAKIIVKAVNAHDELVEALRWLRDNYAAGRTLDINAKIDAALSKAEATS